MPTHLSSMSVRDHQGNVRSLHIVRVTSPCPGGGDAQPAQEYYLLDGAHVEALPDGSFQVLSTREKLFRIER